jgi:tetratricopeptide (TPR) repeat protein
VINPKYAKALHKRALARYELGKYEEAFEDVKLAFNLDKSSTEIHASYSKIL